MQRTEIRYMREGAYMDEYFKEQSRSLEMEKAQIDPEEITYQVNEILKRKNRPYVMENEEYADQLYPYIQEKIPNLIMLKSNGEQWLMATPRAQRKAMEILEKRKVRQLEEVNMTKITIKALEKIMDAAIENKSVRL